MTRLPDRRPLWSICATFEGSFRQSCNMYMRSVICAAALFAAAGCDQQVVETAALTTVPVAYTVTAERAGPIDPGTQYSPAAIRRLFPDGDLETVRTADEAGVIHAITVFEDGLQLFQILPDDSGREIRAVHGSGLAIAGPRGERLGMAFANTGLSREACTVGTGAWAGMAVCRHPAAANVRLVFDNGGWEGPATELAPQRNLASGRLHRIVWEPAGS